VTKLPVIDLHIGYDTTRTPPPRESPTCLAWRLGGQLLQRPGVNYDGTDDDAW